MTRLSEIEARLKAATVIIFDAADAEVLLDALSDLASPSNIVRKVRNRMRAAELYQETGAQVTDPIALKSLLALVKTLAAGVGAARDYHPGGGDHCKCDLCIASRAVKEAGA